MGARTGWWRAVRATLALAVAAGIWWSLAAPALAATDLRGTWTAQISLNGSLNNTQYWRMTAGDPAAGTFTGDTSSQPAGNAFGTLSATLSGTAFHMSNPYTGGGYTATFTGTLTSPTALSGTWTSGSSQSGTWTAALTSPAAPAPGPGTTPDPAGRKPSVVSLLCNRGPDATSTSQCTASVADAGARPGVTPTGTVTWAASSGSLNSTTCTLAATSPSSPTVATCSVTFTPGPGGSPAGTALPVVARYGGDANLAPSGATHRLITALCIGTTTAPCPGTVADAFGLRPEISVSTKATLQRLRTLLVCGAGTQTATQAGLLLRACNNSNLLRALFDDASGDLAKQLDGAEVGSMLSALESAFKVLDTNDRGSDKPCGGGLLGGGRLGGDCSGMLRALGIPPSSVKALADQLTFADVQAVTDLMGDAYLDAANASFDQRLTVVTERYRRDSASRQAMCRDADPAGFVFRAFRCGQGGLEHARRAPRTLLLARGSGSAALGASVSVPLKLTPGGRLIDSLMRKVGGRRVRVVLASTVTVAGAKPGTATRRLVIRLR